MNNTKQNDTTRTVSDPFGDDPSKNMNEIPESCEDMSNLLAHESFMNLTPSVFKDHKNFINTLTAMPSTEKNFTNNFSEKGKEKEKENDKPIVVTLPTARCSSEYIPAISFTNRNDDDDENNSSNKTKIIEGLTTNNSILAKLQLGLVLAEMKLNSKEIMTCNDEQSNMTSCDNVY